MMIYRAAGEPEVGASETGVCRLCGALDRGAAFRDWVKPTFTDHDLLRPGDIVCRGCLMTTQNFSELYQRLLSRAKRQKPWNWSHFVLGGELVLLSKGEKERMREILILSPEVAVIAVSGQKHLCFRARPHVWQFELTATPADPDRLAAILRVTDDLYSRGASKKEIESGHYDARSIQRMGLSEWRALETELRQHRGTPMLELAVFLTQKQESEDADDGDDRGAEPAAEPGGQFALL